MPIEGSTLWEAAAIFCKHLNAVLNRTLTQSRLVLFEVRDGVYIGFRQAGRPVQASLRTRFGPMGLYIGQTCDSEILEDGRHRLYTSRYAYTLTPDGAEQPLFRWEYERNWLPEARWCRHHVQGTVPLPMMGENLSLNDFHLPTGYVTLEEIIRFCLVDLDAQPLSDNWHELLEESYRRFKEEFSPPRG